MPRKVQTAQHSFTLLVANLRGGSDPSRNTGGNPTKIRTGFTLQHFPDVNREAAERGPGTDSPRTPGIGTRVGHVDYTTPPEPVRASGTITVADNDFGAPATIYLGGFVLVSGEHYTPGGGTGDTAIAIAAAIDTLPGFTAIVVGDDVTVAGPSGPNGNALLFSASFGGAIQNFTLDPASGHLTGGEPLVGPPLILT